MLGNKDQKNSEYGHFLPSGYHTLRLRLVFCFCERLQRLRGKEISMEEVPVKGIHFLKSYRPVACNFI